MLREYELTVITSSHLKEHDVAQLCEKYESILFEKGGEVVKKSDWGVKKLAFPINKQFRGFYTHYDLTCDPTCLHEVERLMRIDDNVLRYLSIRLGEDVDVEKRKIEIAKAEALAASEKESRSAKPTRY